MNKYKELTKSIPWASTGRETIASQVGLGLVPIGVLPFQTVPLTSGSVPFINNEHPEWEKFLINIVGTAIQAGKGKLVTCAHVVEAVLNQESKGYILARILRQSLVAFIPYPIQKALRFIDPRSEKVNTQVDLSALIVAAKSTKEVPYEIPNVSWGESGKLGVGDPVIVGGYPYGTEMFKFTKSNRGIIQPTFYSGIISAILPATSPSEIRILQISVPCAVGMSGGAVFDPQTGKVLGMITSCVHSNGVPQPISYAIPSEVIAPYVEVIRFDTK